MSKICNLSAGVLSSCKKIKFRIRQQKSFKFQLQKLNKLGSVHNPNKPREIKNLNSLNINLNHETKDIILIL